jgi:RimJ/RimL family protein N-acetyltransferase
MTKDILIATPDPSVYVKTLTEEEDTVLFLAQEAELLGSKEAATINTPAFVARRALLAAHPEILAMGIWAGDQLVGEFGMWPIAHEPPIAEIGCHVLSAHRRHGYATLAVQSMIPYGLGELGMEEIVAKTMASNEDPQRVLQETGFVQFLAGKGLLHFVYDQHREISPAAMQAMREPSVLDGAIATAASFL